MRDLSSLVLTLFYVEGNPLQIVVSPSRPYYRHTSCYSHRHHHLASATFSSLCSAHHIRNISHNPDILAGTFIVTAFRIHDENRSTLLV